MKVVTFGEILLRLSAPGYSRLFQRDNLETSFCGAEANVAVSIAELGMESTFVSKIPNNSVGQAAINSLRYFGVDTNNIVIGDGRMGLYYLEKGASQRPSLVIYDRDSSAIALSNRDEYNWEKIFEGADWFHWTGINPALGGELPEICQDACVYARKNGITISCDLNYRSKLWSTESAQEIMKPLMQYVDVCICNEEDAEKVLGIRVSDTNVQNGILNESGYVDVARTISKDYGCKYIATTFRKSYSASFNNWSGLLYDAKNSKAYFSRDYDIQIVDRVGGGDSFAAAIIYAISNKMSCQDAVDFAVAASCLKHTIEGDYNRISIEDIYNLLKSGGHGRVQR